MQSTPVSSRGPVTLGDPEKIAEENRVFVRAARNKTELVWLPASDGLDAIIPEIKYSEHPAVDSSQVNDLVRQYVESSKTQRVTAARDY